MIEFSRNVECSFERIMMDNVRNVEVIHWLALGCEVPHCIYIVTREGTLVHFTFYNPHIFCKVPF